MAITYKILGQSNPSATTATTLYTTPSGTTAIVSTLQVCNQAGTAGSFRIAARQGGETLAAKHYLNYDTPIEANDSISFTLGMSLAETDVITVYASSANISFTVFGSELT